MELGILLEEKRSIKSKIELAMYATKKWFEDKMESAKDTFDKIKIKISNSFNKFTSDMFKDKICSKKITIQREGKSIVISNIGERSDSVFTKIKTMINKFIEKIKLICNTIIKECSEAISSLIVIEKIDYKAIEREREKEKAKQERLEKISEIKEKVLDNTSSLTEIVVIVASLLGAVITLRDVSRKIKNKEE